RALFCGSARRRARRGAQSAGKRTRGQIAGHKNSHGRKSRACLTLRDSDADAAHLSSGQRSQPRGKSDGERFARAREFCCGTRTETRKRAAKTRGTRRTCRKRTAARDGCDVWTRCAERAAARDSRLLGTVVRTVPHDCARVGKTRGGIRGTRTHCQVECGRESAYGGAVSG